MKYENLKQLIQQSSSSRRFFLSLPVNMQMKLHEHNGYIHTAEELHRCADAILKYERQVRIIEGFSDMSAKSPDY